MGQQDIRIKDSVGVVFKEAEDRHRLFNFKSNRRVIIIEDTG